MLYKRRHGTCLEAQKAGRMGRLWAPTSHSQSNGPSLAWKWIDALASPHISPLMSPTLWCLERWTEGRRKRWHGMRERDESQHWRKREEDGSFGIFTVVFAWVLCCIIYEINHGIESGSGKQLFWACLLHVFCNDPPWWSWNIRLLLNIWDVHMAKSMWFPTSKQQWI